MAFTYFLRDSHTLELIARHVIPSMAGRSRVSIWDAGCAMGQEAYSLAMILAENMGYFAFKNVRIHATDIDSCDLFGSIVLSGSYQDEELKRMPAELFKKYFEPARKPGCHQISQSLRSRIEYRKHDLLSFQLIGEGFSLVLCKNVLLHFQPEQRIEVIKMFHKALAPGGFFATEQTQKLPPQLADFFEQVTPDAQIFRKIER